MVRFTTYIVLLLLAVAYVQACSPATEEPAPTTGSITGVVTEANSGFSVAQVLITSTNSSSSVTSDVDGFFQINNVVPGDYNLLATRRGFEERTISVSVAAGIETRADFVLDLLEGVRITGRVRDQISKQILEGAVVSSEPFVGSDVTDINGRFALQNILPGTYNFTAAIGEYNTLTRQVIVENGKDSVTINFDLVPVFGIIQGTVRDVSNNTPLAGVNVFTDPATSSIITDESGFFRIERVATDAGAPTEFTITAQKNGFVVASRDITVTPGRTTTADLLLQAVTSN
jgi:hypothetical protein